jgi:hypothetical protein
MQRKKKKDEHSGHTEWTRHEGEAESNLDCELLNKAFGREMQGLIYCTICQT